MQWFTFPVPHLLFRSFFCLHSSWLHHACEMRPSPNENSRRKKKIGIRLNQAKYTLFKRALYMCKLQVINLTSISRDLLHSIKTCCFLKISIASARIELRAAYIAFNVRLRENGRRFYWAAQTATKLEKQRKIHTICWINKLKTSYYRPFNM